MTPMNTKNRVITMVIAAFMTALGVLLPFFTSHIAGVPGTLLLPMHIPVLLCGLLCGPFWGAACGVIVPVLSSLLTGMPPAYPMLPIMLAQLFVIGLISGLLYRRLEKNLFLSIGAAVLAGWAVYGLMFYALMLVGGGQIMALSVTGALAAGIPGLALQFTAVPLLLRLFQHISPTAFARVKAEDKILLSARNLIKSSQVSCVVIKDGAIQYATDGRGVAPLLELYDEKPELARDAFVVDKILGKAGAMILLACGAKRVFAEIMSAAARDYLETRGIETGYGRCVEVISSITGDGMCPIEKSVMEITDPLEGIERIRNRIAEMRNAI